MIMANLVAVPATKLRIFLVDDDTHRHRPLYQVILKLLHEADIESSSCMKEKLLRLLLLTRPRVS